MVFLVMFAASPPETPNSVLNISLPCARVGTLSRDCLRVRPNSTYLNCGVLKIYIYTYIYIYVYVEKIKGSRLHA